MKKLYSILILVAMIMPAFQLQAQTLRQSTYIRSQIVQYVDPITFISEGVKYKVYWVNPNKATDPKNMYVRDVYIVPENYNPQYTGSFEEIPPRLVKIRLHECGNNNDFVEAIVEEKATDKNWYKFGIKLPDDVANRLMDLVEERTKFRVVEGSALDRIFWGVNMDYTTSPELIKHQYLK